MLFIISVLYGNMEGAAITKIESKDSRTFLSRELHGFGCLIMKSIEKVILQKRNNKYGEERKAKRFNPLSLCVGDASKWLQ